MTATDQSRPASSESPNLDVIRAVAVLCVFGGHTADYAFGVRNDAMWRVAQLGVLIFFVHAALVLMRSLERTDATARSLFSAFYIRRAFRIYPLSVLCILGAYLFSFSPNPADGFSRTWTARELGVNLTLTQNLFFVDEMWGGLWTLPLEIQMYVVLPFLFVIFRRHSPVWLLVLWVASVPLAILQGIYVGRLNVLGFVPCFLGGVVSWRLEKVIRPRFPGWLLPAAMAATSVVWLLATRQYQMYHRWAFCLVLGLVLPHFAELRSPLVVRPAQIIARYSYGIYMSHLLALIAAFSLIPGLTSTARWTIFVALAAALPGLMYHLVELPMIWLGQRVARRVTSPRLWEREPAGERLGAFASVP